MSNIGTTDFLLEVAKGNIEGHSPLNLIGFNPSVETSFEDIWFSGGNLVKPTANETWEIVSSDVNDDIVGTGARTVILFYLDEDYIFQFASVDMDGTTPVTLNTNHFRPVSALVTSSGSLETNAGDITIRVSGGGAIRQSIRAGISNSQDGRFTVFAGFTLVVLLITLYVSKNDDAVFRNCFQRPGSTSPIVVGAEFPLYQNTTQVISLVPISLVEKTDITLQAKSSNAAGVPITVTLQGVLIENYFVGTSMVQTFL